MFVPCVQLAHGHQQSAHHRQISVFFVLLERGHHSQVRRQRYNACRVLQEHIQQ